MKHLKSLLAVLLCFVLVFSLAACGSEPADQADGTTTGNSVAGTTRSARTDTGETTTSVVEGGGTTSIVQDNGTTSVVQGSTSVVQDNGTTSVVQGGTTSIATGGNGKVTGGGGKTTSTTKKGQAASNGDFVASLKGLEINIWEMRGEKMERGTTSGDRYYAILNKIGKKYGCTITYKPKTEGDLKTSILSGKPEANVISIQDYVFPAWLTAGVCADLDSAMAQTGIDFSSPWYDKDITAFCNFNGKQNCWNATIREPYMITYNKRMVQEARLADPYSLYEKGQWTYDKLAEYMEKLTKKSASGEVLTNGFMVSTSVSLLMHCIINNGTSAIKVSNGRLVSNLKDKKVTGALEGFRKMSHLTSSGSKWDDAMIYFAQGKAAMCFATKYVFSTINTYGMTDAVGVVPFPMGPDAGKNAKYGVYQTFPTFIAKTDEKDAAKILYVMDEVYKEHYSYRDQDFYDDFRALIRDNKAYETFKSFSLDASKTELKYDSLAGIVWPPAPQAYFNLATSLGTNAVSTAVNTNDKAFNTGLNDVWGGTQFTKLK